MQQQQYHAYNTQQYNIMLAKATMHTCNSSSNTISHMQQQQYHACNTQPYNIMLTKAIMHTCNSSNITHTTAAISLMQHTISLMQHTISCMQQLQFHTCNSSNVMHATIHLGVKQQLVINAWMMFYVSKPVLVVWSKQIGSFRWKWVLPKLK